jgi:hypothetical protein
MEVQKLGCPFNRTTAGNCIKSLSFVSAQLRLYSASKNKVFAQLNFAVAWDDVEPSIGS